MRIRLPRPTPETAFGLAFAVWGLSMGLVALNDNSFITHLATGRLILDRGIPRTDPYSFTAAGEPWVVQSWLASVLYGTLDRFGGGQALLVFHAACTTLLGLACWRLARGAEQLLARLGLTAVAVTVGGSMWSERPLMIGLLGLVAVLLAADDDLDVRWLVPIMWVWVNAHGSFPLAVVLLGALALGRRLDGEYPRQEFRTLRYVVVGILLAAVNPLGPRLLTFPVELLSKQSALSNIVEWQAPGFTSVGQRVFILQLGVAIVGLVRRPRYRSALPMIVFVAMSLIAVRNMAVASLVMLPPTAVALRGLGTLRFTKPSLLGSALTVSLTALGALMVLVAMNRPAFVYAPYPVEAVAWAKQEGLMGPRSRVVTQDVVGNFLEGVYGDEARAFTDDRADFFPDAVSADAIALLRGQPGWQRVLTRVRATAVIWDRSQPLATYLRGSPAWHVVYTDGHYLVAVPRVPMDRS